MDNMNYANRINNSKYTATSLKSPNGSNDSHKCQDTYPTFILSNTTIGETCLSKPEGRREDSGCKVSLNECIELVTKYECIIDCIKQLSMMQSLYNNSDNLYPIESIKWHLLNSIEYSIVVRVLANSGSKLSVTFPEDMQHTYYSNLNSSFQIESKPTSLPPEVDKEQLGNLDQREEAKFVHLLKCLVLLATDNEFTVNCYIKISPSSQRNVQISNIIIGNHTGNDYIFYNCEYKKEKYRSYFPIKLYENHAFSIRQLYRLLFEKCENENIRSYICVRLLPVDWHY